MKQSVVPATLIEITESKGNLQGEVIYVLKPGLFSKNELYRITLEVSPRVYASFALVFRKPLEAQVEQLVQDEMRLLRFIGDTIELAAADPRNDILRQLGKTPRRKAH